MQRADTPLARLVDERCYVIGITRKELATEIGIGYGYLSFILNGRSKPSIPVTERLAELLNVNARQVRELIVKM